ncbi:hypothetical protein HJG60_008442 [Phyllostomus discolor]|uniref:Uncharacterized protein n=1 Tax=Phyllostomus discolor TaxID=89673 RepID=A0A833Z067_9CHIR|nr:hypothetical protein HJG60_008442 [Phyllostomus discolor]
MDVLRSTQTRNSAGPHGSGYSRAGGGCRRSHRLGQGRPRGAVLSPTPSEVTGRFAQSWGKKLCLRTRQCQSLGAHPRCCAFPNSQSPSEVRPRLRTGTGGPAPGVWVCRQILFTQGPQDTEHTEPRRPQRPS